MSVTIYHNPRCSKSRDALRFLNDSGLKPTIVLYMDAGWTAEILVSAQTKHGFRLGEDAKSRCGQRANYRHREC